MRDLVEDYLRTHGGEMVIDPLTLGDVPLQETDEGTTMHDGTREDVPRLVADLVAAGRRVYGVRVLTSTLEDTYLEAVGGETS